MNTTKLSLISLVALALASFSGASLADGKAKFDSACGECHFADDFGGEDVAELSGIIKGIVAGQVKHKQKISLTDAEISEVAAYMAGGGK
jgi:cytochrome c553